MADMLASAVVQETVSRVVSFVLGKREEKASQGHLMERLEMAVSEMEFALERAQDLPIRHLSLLGRRKMIKRAYVEAMELHDRHNQQAAPVGQEETPQGPSPKRKRWILCAKNMSIVPSAGLSIDEVRRFEGYADYASKFVRDVESGCSLHHTTFCSPMVRHLLHGKTLQYRFEQGNRRGGIIIWPTYSEERGVEAVLAYGCCDSRRKEKSFFLILIARLSESTDIVEVATKGLQLLTSEFNLAAECATGEVTRLSNFQDIAHSYGPPWVGLQDWYIRHTHFFRPDPACCKGSRHRLCANNVLSELSDIFPEQVIVWRFQCYYVPAPEPSRSSCSSFDVVGRRKNGGVGMPPLQLTAYFAPHDAKAIDVEDSCVLQFMGDDIEARDASIQQVVEALKSDANNCFFRQPEQKRYQICWVSKHGTAFFLVDKAAMERIGEPRTRSYNTRGSTRR